MKALIHNNPDHSEWFVVNWCLGNTCNFSCTYCPEILHDGSNAWPELDVLKKFISRVYQQKPGKKLAFEFTGGEVTVYKHFEELCDFIKLRGGAVLFISNGSRTLRFWEGMKDKADHVCLSYHAEEGDPDHFFEVVKTLHTNMQVHVNVMMHPNHWPDCMNLAERIVDVPGVTIAIQPLIHDFGDKVFDYEPWQQVVFEEQYKLFQKRIKPLEGESKGFSVRGAMREIERGKPKKVVQPHILISENKNDWSGWSCAAGVEQIIVDMDKTVWRGWCREGGLIGKIDDPDLTLPNDWVDCSKKFCHCNFDIMCTKLEPK
jgi:hypothetical protein